MQLYNKKCILIFFISQFLLGAVYAQGTLSYQAEVAGQFGTGDNAPFWQISNKQGLSNLDPNNAYLTAGLLWNDTISSKFNYKVGVDLVGAINFNSDFFIQQAYAEVNYWNGFLRLGSQNYYPDYRNNLLSSGTMTKSMNARPIPQVSVGLKDYITIPFAKWMQVKAEVSFGKFTDNNYQKDTYNSVENKLGFYTTDIKYHYKNLFIKFEKETNPFSFILGFEMAAQYDGSSTLWWLPDEDIDANWWDVLLPIKGISAGANHKSTPGNILGSHHFILEYIQPDYSIKLYKEHFYEDHSGMFFHNWRDGVWGIEFNKKNSEFIKSILYEFIDTRHQSGPFLFDPTEELDLQAKGGDNYYNNYGYPGWVHWGMSMGTPLITSPAYNRNGYLAFTNNRTRSHHVGVSGTFLSEFDYRLLATYTEGWGTPYIPLIEKKGNFMGMLEVSYKPVKLNGWNFLASVGFDAGDLYGDNFGVNLSIRKEGLLFKKK